MVSYDSSIWDLGPECNNGHFASECTQIQVLKSILINIGPPGRIIPNRVQNSTSAFFSRDSDFRK